MKLSRFQPTIRYLGEPSIEVGGNVAVPEPKMGLTLLGPYGELSKEYEINVGIIGDAESIEKTRNLIERLNSTTIGKDKSFLHTDFPGLKRLRIKVNVKRAIDMDPKVLKQKIDNSSSLSNRVEQVGKLFREKINAMMDVEPLPDYLFVAYPKIVDDYCIKDLVGRRSTPRKAPLEKKIALAKSRNMTLDRFLGIETKPKPFSPEDLRSLIKAYGMEKNVPVQILRPHTINPYDPDSPEREDDATTFWNLVVAMFYKSNYLPWKVRGLLDDTVYVGIAFFRDRDDPTSVKTALAQFFSMDSEGFVLKGSKALIDDVNSPHVPKEEAKRIMQKAIEVYSSTKNGALPRRIVVHKTSRYTQDEIDGFDEGAKGIDTVDLISLGTRSIKLIRWGQKPPIRGTMVRLPDNSILLYTYGYIPYLDIYPGPRVPSPLEILEHHGSTSVDTICGEILALTKLNWNYAKFCIKSPITIGFARRVGNIMRNMPPDIEPKDKFKFYM